MAFVALPVLTEVAALQQGRRSTSPMGTKSAYRFQCHALASRSPGIEHRKHKTGLMKLRLPLYKLSVFLIILLSFAHVSLGQSLEDKLSARADFVPTADTTEGRLIELAQHYKLPMGIEWVFDGNQTAPASPVPEQSTVRELLTFILRDAPGYRAEVQGEIMMVRKPRWAEDPKNFLNLQLTEYRIQRGDVMRAEAALRLQIKATLHPEKYSKGHNGGYGYGTVPASFRVQNISLSGKKLTVRQVLNAIVRQNANSFWIVELVPAGAVNNEVFFATGKSAKDARTDFIWQILPFEKIEQ